MLVYSGITLIMNIRGHGFESCLRFWDGGFLDLGAYTALALFCQTRLPISSVISQPEAHFLPYFHERVCFELQPFAREDLLDVLLSDILAPQLLDARGSNGFFIWSQFLVVFRKPP
jgi:hypothetical protein